MCKDATNQNNQISCNSQTTTKCIINNNTQKYKIYIGHNLKKQKRHICKQFFAIKKITKLNRHKENKFINTLLAHKQKAELKTNKQTKKNLTTHNKNTK